MKRIFLAMALVCAALSANAQHSLQVDDGAGRIGILSANGGMPLGITTFVFPTTGGTLLTTGSIGTTAWLLTGNAGTTAGTNFVGTTDITALHLYVNSGTTNSFILTTTGSIQRDNAGNARGTNAVDMQIARGAATQVASGYHATISGGGYNTVSSYFATVAGGSNNVASAHHSSIGGGAGNSAGGDYSVIAGGYNHIITSTGNGSAIGGGQVNTVSDWFTTVSGGQSNTASAMYSAIGGGMGNLASGQGSFVGGGGWNGTTNDGNTASGNASIVGGGLNNTASGFYSVIGGGQNNTATNALSTVAGGLNNTANGDGSFIGGGESNLSDGSNSFIGAGNSNLITDRYGVIGGGHNNQAGDNTGTVFDKSFATVGGGQNNTASGNYSTVGGGQSNVASGPGSFVGGGGYDGTTMDGNTASGNASTVAGGLNTQATGNYSFVGGGMNNVASGVGSAIAGGSSNVVTGTNSFIGSGYGSSITGNYSFMGVGFGNSIAGGLSAIPGGSGLTLDASAGESFGFLAGVAGTKPMTISAAQTAVFGNTNLWLANNNSTPSELRFYEAESSTGAFPSGTKYVALKSAATLTNTQTYTLPLDYPASNGQALVSTTGGAMSWAALPTGDVAGPASAQDNAVTRFDGTTGKLIQNSALIVEDYSTSTQNKTVVRADDGATADISLVLSPKGNGALIADNPDGAATGGNARGTNAVDLQTSRSNATGVASGNNSVIGGGSNNTASNTTTVVGGGSSNTASGTSSTVGGGLVNTASGSNSTVSGGVTNTASSPYATVGGGSTNTASGSQSVIAGGQSNTASQGYAAVVGGLSNIASGPSSFVGGGALNVASSNQSTVVGGYSNTASGQYSFIGGGGRDASGVVFGNTAGGASSVIVGGYGNTIAVGANYSTIAGGQNLTLSSAAAFGYNGSVNAMTIGAGQVSVFANTNLWLANNNSTPSSLLFYEAESGTGAFPSGTKYVAFKSPAALTATQTYELPLDYPGVSGQVLSSTTGGVLSWAAASALTNFTEAINTAAPNATVPVASLTATNAATDVDAAFIPKGAGAILAAIPDNLASGGNKRGQYAVDLQMSRLAASQVAGGDVSVISGGQFNTASAYAATVSGGMYNTAGGYAATVSGGRDNTANGDYSTISGGLTNVASGLRSTISGGTGHTASSDYATVSGGRSNTATANFATVSGGDGNNAQGEHSVIVGGEGLTLNASADRSFGFLGGFVGPTDDMTISAPNTAVFGNVDLWLANNDNATRELRFYEAYNSSGAFPNTAKHVAFKSPAALTATQTYTLPVDYPASNGRVLASTTGGTLSWAALPAGDVAGPASAQDNAVTRFDGTTGKLIQNSGLILEDYSTSTQNKTVLRADDGATANISLVLAPKGAGALIASNPNGATSGGNARGNFAVDLQLERSGATEVASGLYSVISGGRYNTASVSLTVVGGGESNNNTGTLSVIGGGYQNAVSGPYSVLGGGSGNTIAGDQSVIPGGRNLTLSASADNTFGFNSGTTAMTISDASTSVFANSNLWLANNDNSARQLRFYEAYNASGAFPNTANYTAFKAGTQSADITYTLPTTQPSANQVLAATAVSGSGPYDVTLGWASTPVASYGGNTGGNSVGGSFASPYGIGENATEVNIQIVCTRAGTIKNLYAFCSAAPGVGTDKTITVRKNGFNTALTATIANASTTASNVVNSFTVVAGDLLSVTVTHTGAPANSTVGWGFELY